ncbi:MAG: class F sortase [Candidatus Saccharibacteria bacterium]
MAGTEKRATKRNPWLLLSAGGLCLALGIFFGVQAYLKVRPSSGIPVVGFSHGTQAGAEPVRARIPKLGIDAPIVRLGLNSDGTLAVPAHDNEVGWYAAGARPGDGGPAVLVGHLDSARGAAVFWRLKDLAPGDTVEIDRSDGSRAVFSVTAQENYSQDNFPSQRVYGPVADSELRLITCSGRFDRQAGHYTRNLVVYAVKV